MTIKYGVLGDVISTGDYGCKAFWINWLFSNGYNVPKSIFIPVVKNINEFNKDIPDLSDFERLAIRSSSSVEDNFLKSNAGIFLSFLNIKPQDALSNIMVIIEDALKKSNEPIGVILQEMIDPLYSGVIFSSNPTNASKNEIILSIISGVGDKLLSGYVCGQDILIKIKNEEYIFDNYEFNDIIIDLCRISKKIEKELNFPVDIEWAMDKNSSKLYILQCRPITNIFLKNETICKICKKEIDRIDKRFINSDKIDLRILSESKNVLMSDAYLISINCNHNMVLDYFKSIPRSKICFGYSVVILFPRHISDKVIRSFVGDGNNFERYVSCHRFKIRAYPDFDNIQNCINEMYSIAKEESWICSIIVQEIIRPVYTGIVKKNNEDYILEVARGHYISKGIVPLTRYIVKSDMSIDKNEVNQEEYIEIVEGCTIQFNNKLNSLIQLEDDEIFELIECFRDLLLDERTIVEYGITKINSKSVPYLIDCMKSNIDKQIDTKKIENGIISEGKIIGKMKILSRIDTKDAINYHFYDKMGLEISLCENTIYYSDLPSIEFNYLLKSDNGSIGFVFGGGSVLCHLSTLLREKNIPAIIGIDSKDIVDGQVYELNTSNNVMLSKF